MCLCVEMENVCGEKFLLYFFIAEIIFTIAFLVHLWMPFGVQLENKEYVTCFVLLTTK